MLVKLPRTVKERRGLKSVLTILKFHFKAFSRFFSSLQILQTFLIFINAINFRKLSSSLLEFLQVPAMSCEDLDSLSNSTESSGCHSDLSTHVVFKAVIIGAYSIIFCLGVLGNSLVMYLVARSPEMRTPTYIFIANLAISDIVLCTLAAPFTPISGFLKSWVFGDALCKLVPMVLCLCVHVSTQTSTAIALERYFVIVYPFK